jgi:hypothetical protein
MGKITPTAGARRYLTLLFVKTQVSAEGRRINLPAASLRIKVRQRVSRRRFSASFGRASLA